MTKSNRRPLSRNLIDQMLRAVCGGGFNQAETLASSVLKKQADAQADVISKLG